MNIPRPRLPRLSRRQWIALAVLAALIGLGRWAMWDRRQQEHYLYYVHSIDELRLETRARLRDWAAAHPGAAPTTRLTDLDIAPGWRTDSPYPAAAAQETPGSDEVTVRVYRQSRPDKPVFTKTFSWERFTGDDFLFSPP